MLEIEPVEGFLYWYDQRSWSSVDDKITEWVEIKESKNQHVEGVNGYKNWDGLVLEIVTMSKYFWEVDTRLSQKTVLDGWSNIIKLKLKVVREI